MNEQTVIFAGLPGSGKDTQLSLLREYLEKHDPGRQVVHFDAGAALRALSKSTGYTQSMTASLLRKGELVPLFLISYVMSDFFVSSMHEDEHLLVSGGPRSEEQMEVFNSALLFYKRVHPIVLFLTVPQGVSEERLLKRARSDDTIEAIRSRVHWTLEQTLPVLEGFKRNPVYTYFEINGTPAPDVVHADILRKLSLS